MHRVIDRQDVIEGYRTMLGREPENEETIDMYLRDRLDVWQLLRILADSDEGRRYRLDCASLEFALEPDSRQIDTYATPEQLQQLVESVSSAWTAMGEREPFWSVLVNEKYRTSVINEADQEEFYGTGNNEITMFEKACARNGLALDYSATVLDLGCGVGRVGEHLARRFAHYIGVDISPTHLKQAGERLRHQRLGNTTLSLLGDFLENQLTFDILYSMIALQHSPPPVMLWLLQRCFASLRTGGYAFFQLPCHLYGYEFHLDGYLAEPDRHHRMEMHALPQRYVYQALAEYGLVPVEVLPYPRTGPAGHSYLFLARKR